MNIEDFIYFLKIPKTIIKLNLFYITWTFLYFLIFIYGEEGGFKIFTLKKKLEF